MQLEVGDYFVITQGQEMHPVLMGITSLSVDLPVLHDTTWSGIVLEVLEVQGTQVAAEIVGRSAGSPEAPCRALGTRHVLDLTKVVWEPVSKRFAQVMSQPPAAIPARNEVIVQMGYATGGEPRPSHGCADERDQT